MHAIAEFIGAFLLEGLGRLAYHTARIALLIVSLGLIHVESIGSRYPREPQFGWHNVIWKWDGRRLWVSSVVAYFLGVFLWGVVLAALLNWWRA